MTPQPQPQSQPQPVYQSEMNFGFDKLYTRVTMYVDMQIEKLAVQMRVYNQESINRDNELAQAIKVLAQQVADVKQQVADVKQQVVHLDQRLTKVEETQQTILQIIGDFRAEVMEAINDIRRKDKE